MKIYKVLSTLLLIIFAAEVYADIEILNKTGSTVALDFPGLVDGGVNICTCFKGNEKCAGYPIEWPWFSINYGTPLYIPDKCHSGRLAGGSTVKLLNKALRCFRRDFKPCTIRQVDTTHFVIE